MKNEFDTFKYDEDKSAVLKENGFGCHRFGEVSLPEKLHTSEMNGHVFKTRKTLYRYSNVNSAKSDKPS